MIMATLKKLVYTTARAMTNVVFQIKLILKLQKNKTIDLTEEMVKMANDHAMKCPCMNNMKEENTD